MKSKHTPGPWEVPLNYPTEVYKGEDHSICEVYGAENSEINEANARLIAAAPELLLNCKAILAALNQNKIYPKDLNMIKKLLVDIIAKTEGHPSKEDDTRTSTS